MVQLLTAMEQVWLRTAPTYLRACASRYTARYRKICVHRVEICGGKSLSKSVICKGRHRKHPKRLLTLPYSLHKRCVNRSCRCERTGSA